MTQPEFSSSLFYIPPIPARPAFNSSKRLHSIAQLTSITTFGSTPNMEQRSFAGRSSRFSRGSRWISNGGMVCSARYHVGVAASRDALINSQYPSVACVSQSGCIVQVALDVVTGWGAGVLDRPDMLGKPGITDCIGSGPRVWMFVQRDALEE